MGFNTFPLFEWRHGRASHRAGKDSLPEIAWNKLRSIAPLKKTGKSISMDWLKGNSEPETIDFPIDIMGLSGLSVNFPLNQSIEIYH